MRQGEVIRHKVEVIDLLHESLNVHLQPGEDILLKYLDLELVHENANICQVAVHVVLDASIVLLRDLSAHNLLVC
jgi:hypothetical protein